MNSALVEEVKAIIDEAAATVILPRFQKLRAGDIEEKTPGELVTVADKEAEAFISRQLASLIPQSKVVGEEAASNDPTALHVLSSGDVWLVDPLDGTANFVDGSPDFAVMVALLRDGCTIASWMYQPATDTWAIAVRGAGAHLNGIAARFTGTPISTANCRGSVLTRFLPEERKAAIRLKSGQFGKILPGRRCSGVDYPSLVLMEQHFLVFWRALPWDHAPGALFVEEAGGMVARLDGSMYMPADQTPGLIVARDRDVWDRAHFLVTP
ncbi:inositol monophosphatase [Rhizobium leguminosarum bv. viciae]|nr:inositol monophosphatase [Rhizobium leguminosarum bv. viciae]